LRTPPRRLISFACDRKESEVAMNRSIVCGFVAAMMLVASVAAAELPSQGKKARSPEALKHCNIAGSPGVLAANGVCVRLSGYISAGFNAGQIK
jgi:hypothetical protein